MPSLKVLNLEQFDLLILNRFRVQGLGFRAGKKKAHLGGCQNYGPFWIPIIVRHVIFGVPKKGPP